MSPPMTPREIIEKAVAVARGDTHEGKYWAQLSPKSRDDAELGIRRLAAAGYRILGPDELDPVTVEKCAALCEQPRTFIDGTVAILPSGRAYATAIRALCATHQGDK